MSAGGPGYWMRPLPPALPLVPLDEMIARIEAIRREPEPAECDAVTPPTSPVTYRCSMCARPKDLHTGFYRDARNANGYASICKQCKSERYDKPASFKRRIGRIVARRKIA